jgi:hypothetical protein
LCGQDGKYRVLGGSRVVRLAESHGATPGLPLEWVYVGGCEHGTVVIVPSGHGKCRAGATTTSRVIRRLCLLDDLIDARRSADRSRADGLLVEAKRWLGRHPFDVRVAEARDRLRVAHPVDRHDTQETHEA